MKISIIIPCYNEGNNVIRLANRLLPILESLPNPFEVIYMDDSSDDTPTLLKELNERDARFRYVHRMHKRGLATAVLDGFRIATGDVFVVMDADLQHPTEIIPEMLSTLQKGYDMVIPSRFVPGGKDGGLNWSRKVVSWTARTIARVALKNARKITDPTSGMFMVRREAIDYVDFQPIGWKIMLEILVRGRIDSVVEIPYTFVARDLGSSKMSSKEQIRYLQHVCKLVLHSEEDLKFWKFCLVGGSGLAVNTAAYVSLVELDVYVVYSFLIASLISMASNFMLNNWFTWRHSKLDSIWGRFFKFIIVSIGGIMISSSIVYALYHWIELNYILSGWVGVVGGIAWNYVLNDRWTFFKKKTDIEVEEPVSTKAIHDHTSA
jgi:dolichol-phosphate mannosyltransferase